MYRRLGRIFQRVSSNVILRRTIKAAFTIFVVTTLTFFIVRLMPSNPIDVFIHQQISQYAMTYQEAKNLAAALFALDLDAPLYRQYLGYIRNLIRGNLGTSLLSQGTPVTEMIAKFLPWTLFSVGISLLTSFSLGIVVGMVMAYKRGSLFDHVLSGFASIVSAIPNYIVGILLLVFLGVRWKVFPISAMRGSVSPGIQPGFTWEFISDIFFHATMPIITYIVTTVGTWMLTMKSSTISTLGEDYVTVAKARGLPERRITLSYVGRNAILPLFTNLAISIGFMVGGSILIETYFVYKGIGFILGNSIAQRDYPVMQGVFLMITISVILANFMADLLYSRLDPRIRVAGGGE
ncbi:MAG: ABC transporter permease [bacterium]